jgi:hypothetical protein
MHTKMRNLLTHRSGDFAMKWVDIFLRFVGVFLGGGGLLGYIWFFHTSSITSFAPPLFLLMMSMTKRERLVRHWMALCVGFGLCVLDIAMRGFPFFRHYEEFDVEFMFAVQIALLAYFVIRGLVDAEDSPFRT